MCSQRNHRMQSSRRAHYAQSTDGTSGATLNPGVRRHIPDPDAHDSAQIAQTDFSPDFNGGRRSALQYGSRSPNTVSNQAED
jgi:hypothetical protein